MQRVRGSLVRLRNEVAFPALACVLVATAIILVVAGQGTSFSGDDFSYYGRQVVLSGHGSIRHFDSVSLEYLLIPHNGHLQVAGKLVYEAVFDLFGAKYLAFRIVSLVSVAACVVLFFLLARRRIDDRLGLLGAILLSFLGAAWEVQLWAFDMHATFAAAAGMGAWLIIDSSGRRRDLMACALLVLACGFIEVGLVFAVAVGAQLLLDPRSRRRVWVAVVPVALFACWYIWATRYDFDVKRPGVLDLGPSILHSAGDVAAALTGTLHTGAAADVLAVQPTDWSLALGISLLVALTVRVIRVGNVRVVLPPAMALVVYWLLLALSGRPEGSSRYMLVGAVLTLLLIATCLQGWTPGRGAFALCALAVAIAIPGNLAKLGDGAGYLRADAELTRGELAMFQLAGTRADPDYRTYEDRSARLVGASPAIGMSVGEYAEAARRRGSLAAPIDEVRADDMNERRVFDTVLAGALNVALQRAGSPNDRDGCSSEGEDGPASLELPSKGVLVRADVGVALGLSRFTVESPAIDLGVGAATWYRLDLRGPDSEPDPWRLFADGPVTVCPIT